MITGIIIMNLYERGNIERVSIPQAHYFTSTTLLLGLSFVPQCFGVGIVTFSPHFIFVYFFLSFFLSFFTVVDLLW